MPFFRLAITCSKMPISPTNVFPDAVGVARTKFFPSKTPDFIASSCGGYKSVIPVLNRIFFTDSGIGKSIIFKYIPSIDFIIEK